MIRVLVTIVLPLLLPFALYGAWLMIVRRQKPDWQAGPILWSLAGGVLLVIVTLALFGIEGRESPGEKYVPPRVTDEGIQPGHFERQ